MKDESEKPARMINHLWLASFFETYPKLQPIYEASYDIRVLLNEASNKNLLAEDTFELIIKTLLTKIEAKDKEIAKLEYFLEE